MTPAGIRIPKTLSKTRQISASIGALGAFVLVIASGCLRPAQKYSDFTTPTPLRQNDYLIIGIVGGRQSWNNDKLSVRQLALRLRDRDMPGVRVETLENAQRPLAVQLIRKALDRDSDGTLSGGERESARIILYGLSFGAAAVAKLSWELDTMGIPVLLTVQVDSVGVGDASIPPNVRRAANFYQPNGWFIKGEPEIRAADPARTKIIGNFKYDYSNKDVDISHVHWFRKLFRVAHAKMSFDPDVWAEVETLIINVIQPAGERRPTSRSRH